MGSVKTAFYCGSCGAESLRWEGRCPACGEWNSLSEAPRPMVRGGGARGGFRKGNLLAVRGGVAAQPQPLGEVADQPVTRSRIGFGDFDRVLGGGLVPGVVVLLGGAPGIGKSTLMLQACARLAVSGKQVLYVSGEESREQVGLRAQRLSESSAAVLFLSTTDLTEVLTVVEEQTPDFLLVDSIQTLLSSDSSAAAGGVKQLQESTAELHGAAKRLGMPTFLIGHVTKGGGLAGPRTLEHMVDVVLMFEGQRLTEHRWLRAVKNRFGSVDELAAYRMLEQGLEPLEDPSTLFVGDRSLQVSGTAVCVVLQGRRPMLVEVQALCAPARFTTPQRVATGIPPRRLALLLAVLERKAGVSLTAKDVFVSVVGGLRLTDPGADLAVLAALISAELDRPVPPSSAFVGEVGLAGELRGVPQAQARVKVAAHAGFPRVFLPLCVREDGDWGRKVRFAERVRDLVNWLSEG